MAGKEPSGIHDPGRPLCLVRKLSLGRLRLLRTLVTMHAGPRTLSHSVLVCGGPVYSFPCQIFLSPFFFYYYYLYPFPSSDHPAKPLVIVPKSIETCVSGHLSR